MKIIYFLAIFVILTCAPVFGDKKISSHKIDRTITVDGKGTDWEGLPMTFFEDDKMSIGIAHTDEFLYFLLKTRDDRTARMIRGQGLKIWLDKNGKKKRTCGLIFTGGPKIDFSKRNRPDQDRDGELERRRQDFSERNNNAGDRLIFIDEDNYVYEAEIAADGFEGPQIVADTSLSFYTYEIAIQLGQTELPTYRLDLEDKDKLLVGFEWGGRPEGARDENMSGEYSGGTGGRGGGGGGGGRMGGGGGGKGGGMGQMGGRKMPRKSEIWIKVSLEKEEKEEK